MFQTSLSAGALEEALSDLSRANLSFAARAAGPPAARQPVHTVYGGAHLFRADTARKLGAIALGFGLEIIRVAFRRDVDRSAEPREDAQRLLAQRACPLAGEREVVLGLLELRLRGDALVGKRPLAREGALQVRDVGLGLLELHFDLPVLGPKRADVVLDADELGRGSQVVGLDDRIAASGTVGDTIRDPVARDRGRAVGYALYFYTFSTFLARPTLYLEDLFVLPETRGKGFGRELFQRCVREGRKRGCGRMEWAVLDWNEPAIRVYDAIGAEPQNEWIRYRLSGDRLKAFAAG